MPDRDEVLKQWVKQPPAAPNVQYLRDVEREAALDQLGQRSSILDIASESSVTAKLEAKDITRVDFSEQASAYASEILGSTVDEYEVADPDSPSLPVSDDSFDAAVSLGPFDWKFLDIQNLIDELHRVTIDDGLVVFSVPTPRSPYYGDTRNRFYSSSDARTIVSPDWLLRDVDLLFQYPTLLNTTINALPSRLQEPFVNLEWTFSEWLTSAKLWDQASYIVLGVQPIDYRSYLGEALECLFRPTGENGFWDPNEGKIVRALDYTFEDGNLTWTLDDSTQWRYAPFGLMGVMHWRNSELGSARFDEKIKRTLTYFTEQMEDASDTSSMPSYGKGPLIMAFAVAADVFGDEQYAATARNLYERTAAATDFTHAEDSLLPFGWSYLFEHTNDDAIADDIQNALWTLNERLSSEDLFEFENPTARRHQNQMYTLWGLCRAIEVTDSQGFLATAERVLDYTIEHRMRDDGAFLWQDVPRSQRSRAAVAKQLGVEDRPPHWDFLYECHQTFFVNAVEQYYRAGGSKNYDAAVHRAMEWIYGTNSMDIDLVEYCGLGVPMRFMTVDERMDVPDQMYKGSYEIGSYILALTNLVTGAVARGQGGQ